MADNYVKQVKPHLNDIKEWIKKGETLLTVAKKLGVCESTFYAYKRKYPALEEAITTGKQNLIEHIESSLYKRCIGYEAEEVKTYMEVDKNGKEKKRIEKFTKYIPPSDTAIIFTLCNLKPGKWKRNDKDENVQLKENTVKIEFSDERIKKAFDVLYPPIEKEKNKKNDK